MGEKVTEGVAPIRLCRRQAHPPQNGSLGSTCNTGPLRPSLSWLGCSLAVSPRSPAIVSKCLSETRPLPDKGANWGACWCVHSPSGRISLGLLHCSFRSRSGLCFLRTWRTCSVNDLLDLPKGMAPLSCPWGFTFGHHMASHIHPSRCLRRILS